MVRALPGDFAVNDGQTGDSIGMLSTALHVRSFIRNTQSHAAGSGNPSMTPQFTIAA